MYRLKLNFPLAFYDKTAESRGGDSAEGKSIFKTQLSIMKKYSFILFLALSLWFHGEAQYVTIPDANFVTWLNAQGYAQCLSGNQLDTTCPALISTKNFSVGFNSNVSNLTGIQYFDSLTQLYCYPHSLAYIPALPNQLLELYCNQTAITSLPPLPNNLRLLQLESNTSLILPTVWPDSLNNLDINACYFDSILTLPNNLKQLQCAFNHFTHLPLLPNTLQRLFANNNRLDSLPNLPNSLLDLGVSANRLHKLPSLPSGILYINIDQNFIDSLPPFPNSLVELYLSSNPFQILPELPDSLYRLYLNNDTNLTCLPQLKRIVNLFFVNAGILCLPNHGNVTNSNPPLSYVPVCDYSNSCGIYWNVTGKVFFDYDNNCIQNGIDTGVNRIKVMLRNNGVVEKQTYTLLDGTYSFNTDTFGTYTITIDTTNIPFSISCPLSGTDTAIVSQQDSLINEKNFALSCKTSPGFDVGVTSITAGVHGVELLYGADNTVRIKLYNDFSAFGINCDSGVSGRITLIINGQVSFVSPTNGSPLPDSTTANGVIWDVSNFDSFNSGYPLDVIVHVDSLSQLGKYGCFTVIVTHPVGDYNTANDTLTHCFEIGLPFDPNGKEVYPAGDIDVDTSQRWLTYTIYFQNTGTAVAQKIHVNDTLDNDLDVSTFQLLAYSHEPIIQIKGNAVLFNYPNINLPDSNANEPASHGYVQYKIKLKDNLPVGTNISNTAYIYFGFNAPVVTNTTTNTVTTTTTVSIFQLESFNFQLYPNPAKSTLNVTGDDNIIGSTLTIYDMTGKKLTTISLTAQHSIINSESFSDGVYIAEIKTKEASVRRRWVKM